MPRPTLICLTPVRNEEWVLERFLQCASLWADRIIIADQGSTDRSAAIAAAHPKVHLIPNPHPAYDECARQKLLIDEARALVPGPRLLVALDADEVFTGNFAESAEWPKILNASPGTVIYFKWINLKPGGREAWLSDTAFPWGFVDDGAAHSGETIHSQRVPVRVDSPKIFCEEIKVLHLQYIDTLRMESKHRWYQCFERLQNPAMSAIRLFDKYHHMYRVPAEKLIPLAPGWSALYAKMGIDLFAPNPPAEGVYWWDHLVREMIAAHGAKTFTKENIWDGWPPISEKLGATMQDPRTGFERRVHRFLKSPANLKNAFWTRWIRSGLKRVGW